MDDLTGTSHPAHASPPALPGYEVLHLLGRGGSGTVWAVRRGDGVRFAAKVVDGGVDELDHEVELLRAVEHPHLLRIVDALEVGDDGDPRAVLITELAEGGSLAQSIRARERFTPGELVTVLCPIARALHDLHGIGLVHADLSPGNILLTADGKPLIADLGVSRIAGVEGDEVWATELWAAPEVLAGSTPSPASDVYSLGAVAWAALTGAPPEPAVLRPDLADLAPELSRELRDVVMSCLAHTPSTRPSAGDLALMLWDCATAEPAPVQGSPGARVASTQEDGDPSFELTRRMRAQAQVETRTEARHASAEPTLPWWRGRVTRRVAALGAAVGVVCAGAAAAGPPALAWVHRHDQAAAPAPDAARTATRTPTTSTGHGRASPTPSPSASGVSSAAAGPAALPDHATEVVQRLVTARAHAWTTGDEHALGASMAAHSAAYSRDRSSLRTAAGRGAHYRGLTFRVRSATLQPGGQDSVQVRATIDRSAYDLVTTTGTKHLVADPGERIDLQLQWTTAGWRIVDWSSIT
ncbi:serine/threonine-protein kinase [Leekyejoonella antrihumi]|uniref:non-specific serine/threonine protein kinase n=1 Tax=Leekyejoonella antrihumi TaxID=1660198 RepID=A0A563E3E3_9MICO|nr:serine/threonine-protein kinase [Leekyejoonella antrihumi]TWP37038.1 serine/threonine protein kinase [Leekyejoonella antrihumi]